jgi:anaerobic selenocysteine-containing dehydrogenase
MTPVLKKKIFENIENSMGIKLPTKPGMDTISCLTAAYEGKIDLAFLLGGNLFGATPDSKFAQKALNEISFKVFMNTTLNQGHFSGVEKEVVILPVAARDEELQKTTQESMFNFVRMSDGGIVRLDNVRSEVEIISDIARKVMGISPIDFGKLSNHQNLRKFIAMTVPGFEKLSELEKTGEEFQISNRTFHNPYFATPDRKANFRICPIPYLKKENGEFQMMSIRSEGQFNSIIYEEEDIYREQKSRWIVMMNKNDISNKGLKENDLVNLESPTGKMKKVLVREFDIPPGNVMTYYPESNVLISTKTDPRSRTPAYKSVSVKVTQN